MRITSYKKASTLEEAATLLQSKKARILGGMHWLKMQDISISTAIDISNLGLNTIEETDDYFTIGSCVTLRTLETDNSLNSFTQNAFKECLKNIVGVQFRNTATAGANVFSRYGFSDLITLLLTLDAEIVFYRHPQMKLEDFLNEESFTDILTYIKIPKSQKRVSFISQRNTSSDFSVLNAAVSKDNEYIYCSVGARPSVAKLVKIPLAEISSSPDEKELSQTASSLSAQFDYGSNMRASCEYRQKISTVLIKRNLMSVFDVTEEV